MRTKKAAKLPRGLQVRNGWYHYNTHVHGKRYRGALDIAFGGTEAEQTQMRKDATDKLARIVDRLADPKVRALMDAPATACPTFAEFAEFFIRTHIMLHGNARQVAAMIRREFIPHFGAYRLDAIRRDEVTEFSAAFRQRLIADGRTQNTANQYLRRLIQIFLAAVKADKIAVAPTSGIVMVKIDPPANAEARLTGEEVDRVIECLNSHAYKTLFRLSYFSLQRIQSCIDLQWMHDKGTELQFLKTKTKKAVTVTLAPDSTLRACLDHLRPASAKPTDYIFASLRGSRANPAKDWWYNRAIEQFATACKKAGITYGRKNAGVTWHKATRASAATTLMNEDVDPKTVQEMGAWASFAQMDPYLKSSQKSKAKAAAMLDRKVAAPPPPPGKPLPFHRRVS